MRTRLALSAVLAFGLCASAHAGLISGSHFLSNGKEVALQGLEWMPLTYTAGLSRSEIEAGFTDRFGNVWAAGEWQYATRTQTEALLGSLWDQQFDGWSQGNAIGAGWFIDSFGGLMYDVGYGPDRINNSMNSLGYQGSDYSHFYFGQDGDCNSDNQYSCLGLVSFAQNYSGSTKAMDVQKGVMEFSSTANSGPIGNFNDAKGLNAGLNNTTNSYVDKDQSAYFRGSMLVRTSPSVVPNPVSESSSLGVLAAGLMILLFRRRPAGQ